MAFVDAPDGFIRSLEPLPDHSSVVRDAAVSLDVAVLFVSTRLHLTTLLPGWSARLASSGTLWVAWPSGQTAYPTDLTMAGVEAAGTAAGLVPGRIEEIDAVWVAVSMTRPPARPR